MKRYLLPVLLVLLGSFPLAQSYYGEIDGVALSTGVHDGDTFYIDRDFHGSHTIRLADIDTAELGQPNSAEARGFLSNLVDDRTVYLDIDDVYTFDDYGHGDRLVCVVYVDYNGTHYENVNKALLASGYAVEYPHPNEFDQRDWSLYVSKQEIVTEFPSTAILAFLLLGAMLAFMLLALILLKKRRTKPTS